MLIRDEEVARLQYRGEGNSSLVLALDQERRVVRLLKTRVKTQDELRALLDGHIGFNERVLPHVLPREFFRAPRLVRLTSAQLAEVRALADQRPAHRRDKEVPALTLALLLPDYSCLPRALLASAPTVGPEIGVEIKPKQGFLPDARVLRDELRVKARVCRFGLNQFHKLHKGSVSARSKYCPLDLFSGCPQRQTRALEALVESPQNNFRLFRDQNYAFGDASNARFDDAIAGLFPDVPDDATDDARRRQAFCRLLVVALNKGFARAPPLRPDPRWPPQQTCQLHPSRCTCGSRHALDQGSVLSAVLCAQRLDQLDSRLANEKWTALNNNNAGDCPLDHAPDWVPEWAGREGRAPQESEREWSVRQVWQFLVALTAKDCSVMLALKRLDARAPHLDEHVVGEGGARFLASVRVTDLDQKPCLKIARTLSNDLRMVRRCARHK